MSWASRHSGSGPDLYTRQSLFHQEFVGAFLSKDGPFFLLAPNGFWSALYHEYIEGKRFLLINGPFDVLRTAIILFHSFCIPFSGCKETMRFWKRLNYACRACLHLERFLTEPKWDFLMRRYSSALASRKLSMPKQRVSCSL